jgi:arylsulfatase
VHECWSVLHEQIIEQEMWRFQIPAQVISKYVPTFVEFRPMQAGASFNISGLKEKAEQAIAAAKGCRIAYAGSL